MWRVYSEGRQADGKSRDVRRCGEKEDGHAVFSWHKEGRLIKMLDEVLINLKMEYMMILIFIFICLLRVRFTMYLTVNIGRKG